MNICTLFDLMFRSSCLLCGGECEELPNLCLGCYADLPTASSPSCPICACPWRADVPCTACLSRPPAFSSTCSALRYEGAAAHLLQRYKFGQDLAAGNALAEVLVRSLAAAPRPDIVIAVPSSTRRRRRRGFDVARELARTVCRRLQLRLDLGSATRPVDRPPQSVQVGTEMRQRNVQGVFHVKPGALAGRCVAVVDDVMTSGATAEAFARTLRAAGVDRVSVWVACRAISGPRDQASRFATDSALL